MPACSDVFFVSLLLQRVLFEFCHAYSNMPQHLPSLVVRLWGCWSCSLFIAASLHYSSTFHHGEGERGQREQRKVMDSERKIRGKKRKICVLLKRLVSRAASASLLALYCRKFCPQAVLTHSVADIHTPSAQFCRGAVSGIGRQEAHFTGFVHPHMLSHSVKGPQTADTHVLYAFLISSCCALHLWL